MSTIELLPKESYLAMIQNAVGSQIFRTLYARVDEGKKDILRDGDLSCAFFVSSILHNFKLIASPHATVIGLERDLQACGWTRTDTPHPGAILIWEPVAQDGEVHPHVGFCIADDRAISNDYKTRVPIEHNLTFGTKSDGTLIRAVTGIYTHPLFVSE